MVMKKNPTIDYVKNFVNSRKNKGKAVKDCANILGVSERTIYRYLKK